MRAVASSPLLSSASSCKIQLMQVSALKKFKRVSRKAIKAVVSQIAEKFHPQKIILFGSYAYGQPHPGSDVDLLIVMETPLKETGQAVRICQEIDYHFGLDLMVLKPKIIKRRLFQGDSFLTEIMEKGKVLYESTNARVD